LVTGDGVMFSCDICGPFGVTGSAIPSFIQVCSELATRPLSPRQRAALSHAIRSKHDAGAGAPLLYADRVADFIKQDQLPSLARQAANVIRMIGDAVRDTGNSLPHLPDHFSRR